MRRNSFHVEVGEKCVAQRRGFCIREQVGTEGKLLVSTGTETSLV